MTKYLDKKFNSPANSKKFVENYDKVFAKEENMCMTCHKNPAEEWHSCPYHEEINDNYEDGCNCCEDCRHECCMEI